MTKEKEKLVKVIFVRGCADDLGPHLINDIREYPEERAKGYIKEGWAKRYIPPPKKDKEKYVPAADPAAPAPFNKPPAKKKAAKKKK